MCRKEDHDGKYDITYSQVKDLIEVMPYLQKLVLRGGEVFFNSSINEIIKSANEHKVQLHIVTNGLLLDEERIYEIIKNNISLVISIDSPFKKTYEAIRVGGNFDKLINNINIINRIKKDINPNFLLSINMVVMKQNYCEIEDMIKFASKYKFISLSLCKVESDRPDEIIDCNIDNNIIKQLSEKYFYFEQLAKEYKIDLFNKLPRCITVNKQEQKTTEIKRQFFCSIPWRSLFINDLCKPYCNCNQFVNMESLFGNGNFILSLWNSDLLQRYRENISLHQEYQVCSSKCLENPLINSCENKIEY